jgi:hypothetical protein
MSTLAPAETVEIEAPPFLSVAEAVTFSRLSRRTLYTMMAQKSLRSFSLCRPGCGRGKRLVSRADLVRFIESHAA